MNSLQVKEIHGQCAGKDVAF